MFYNHPCHLDIPEQQRPGLQVHLAFVHFHQVPSQVSEACRVGDSDARHLNDASLARERQAVVLDLHMRNLSQGGKLLTDSSLHGRLPVHRHQHTGEEHAGNKTHTKDDQGHGLWGHRVFGATLEKLCPCYVSLDFGHVPAFLGHAGQLPCQTQDNVSQELRDEGLPNVTDLLDQELPAKQRHVDTLPVRHERACSGQVIDILKAHVRPSPFFGVIVPVDPDSVANDEFLGGMSSFSNPCFDLRALGKHNHILQGLRDALPILSVSEGETDQAKDCRQ
mmetsp:Transcript_91821/g.159268  ORF Transcript_91821/g.159268 Transcript_91821/m.159268 type:complete len:278 (+) Transcript_91821:1124-1957(+)